MIQTSYSFFPNSSAVSIFCFKLRRTSVRVVPDLAGNASLHRLDIMTLILEDAAIVYATLNTFITSSPKWLMTLTAMRPCAGRAKGREVSE